MNIPFLNKESNKNVIKKLKVNVKNLILLSVKKLKSIYLSINFGPLVSLSNKLGRFLYKLCYRTGDKTEQIVLNVTSSFTKIYDTATSELFSKVGDMIRKLGEIKRSKLGRGEVSLTRKLILLTLSIKDAFKICAEAFSREGFVTGFKVIGRFMARGFSRFFDARKTIFNYLAPVASIIVLVLTIYMWSNTTFALSVDYGDTNLGIVKNEQTFRDAAKEVEINVSDASGKNFKLDNDVKYKFVIAKKTEVSDSNQIYNNIVMQSCGGVETGYGLYIDNRLAGATTENGVIEAMLNDMTNPYKKDTSVQSVGFVQDVTVKAGLFPSNVFKSTDQIKSLISGDDTTDKEESTETETDDDDAVYRISFDPLYAMNLSATNNVDSTNSIVAVTSAPKLQVKVVKNEVYSREVAYTSSSKESDSIYKGKTKVSTKGVNGEEEVTAAVTYLDGEKQGEKILETKVTKEPVNEVILVGTKKKVSVWDDDGSYGADGSGGNYSVVSTAKRALGVHYISGGTSMSGFDCSGFTQYVYKQYGIYLPHSAAAQSAYGSKVSKSNLQAGDLVFFDTNGGRKDISHVGIYIGNGSFINASTGSTRRVKIDSIYSSYYSSKYITARRVK